MPAVSESSLFDDFGRCLPGAIRHPVHPRSRRYFALEQPEIDYAASHERLLRHLGAGENITMSDFAERAERILARLKATPRTEAIARGVAVPFILPRITAGDMGHTLDTRFLPALGRAFETQYPDYRFTNHNVGGLDGRISIQPNSRHNRLVDAMGREEQVGIYFPALTEYSLPAALEQVQALPEQFLLAGGADTCAAMISAPGLLLRTDSYPPLLWLGALVGEQASIGYHIEAYGYNLTFNRRAHLGQAAEYWTCGLTVLEGN